MTQKYLDYLRAIKKAKSNKCAYCQDKSIGIIAEGYKIKFVCKSHFKNPPDCILDLSNPKVLHYIYPNGVKWWRIGE